MDSVKYIFGYPEVVDGINIYPIKMKNYDEFMNIANILTLSYDHFNNNMNIEELEKKYGDYKFELLDLLFIAYSDPQQAQILIDLLSKVFSYVCHNAVMFNELTGSFVIADEEEHEINRTNYNEIREVILKQNLIFTPKIYKNKLVQEWVDIAIKQRAETALKITVEDMITTISASNGMDIDLMKEYTIYRIKALFYRILKMQEYKTITLFQTVDTSGKLHAEHFAEEIDMFKNPYDDVIKDNSQHKHIEDSINNKY